MADIISAECDIARKNDNTHGLNCTVVKHDYFQDIPKNPGESFDWILSNPPELPSKTQFDIRECGFETDWDPIDRTFEIAKDKLKPTGQIMMYVLDLLGIVDPTGNPTLFSELVKKTNFEWKIVRKFKRKVHPGSPVFREIRHVAETTPQAEFFADESGSIVMLGTYSIDNALQCQPFFITTNVIVLKWK